mmetsp:Transcript_82261/g.233244  ORF Transcript_82261/g.233244 Transcript_82261/m.233244 type:complete len:219 (-) Transcript_82261:1603-2259(-)
MAAGAAQRDCTAGRSRPHKTGPSRAWKDRRGAPDTARPLPAAWRVPRPLPRPQTATAAPPRRPAARPPRPLPHPPGTVAAASSAAAATAAAAGPAARCRTCRCARAPSRRRPRPWRPRPPGRARWPPPPRRGPSVSPSRSCAARPSGSAWRLRRACTTPPGTASRPPRLSSGPPGTSPASSAPGRSRRSRTRCTGGRRTSLPPRGRPSPFSTPSPFRP